MSGHSKWHNIQHRKGLQDAKRGKIFTKLIREITSAARVGGGDPAGNPRLRAAIAEALSNNMTRDTVERAVKRGAGGEGDGAQLETLTYEGYGPAGTAIMVECMTDNKNRTVADVRHVFTRYGGNLGNSGSVSYLFNKKGVFSFDQGDEDKIMEVALDAGAVGIDIARPDQRHRVASCLLTDRADVGSAIAVGHERQRQLVDCVLHRACRVLRVRIRSEVNPIAHRIINRHQSDRRQFLFHHF